MININLEIFKRYNSEKKISIINSLSQSELLMLTSDSIIRIIKEIGKGRRELKRSSNKDLTLNNAVSNNWNAAIEGFSYYNKVLYIQVYLQYSNTDTCFTEYFSKFDKKGTYKESFEYKDRWNHSQTIYYTFTEADKAEVYKEVLLTYIKNKYKDKLNGNTSKTL